MRLWLLLVTNTDNKVVSHYRAIAGVIFLKLKLFLYCIIEYIKTLWIHSKIANATLINSVLFFLSGQLLLRLVLLCGFWNYQGVRWSLFAFKIIWLLKWFLPQCQNFGFYLARKIRIYLWGWKVKFHRRKR